MSRLNYSVLPASRNEALNEVADDGHIHCLYEPFKVPTKSLKGQFKCAKCKGFYGCSRIVDVGGEKKWICIFCNGYNDWDYDMPDCETYASKIGMERSKKNVLVIIVDTICDKEELQALQKQMKLDPHAKYALVTLHRNGDVAVHSPENIRSFGIGHHKVEHSLKRFNGEYFARHLDHVFFDSTGLMNAISKLEAKDSHGSKRARRATGLALFLASILGDEAVCFLMGPCTEGLGKVVSKEKRNMMRQQQDLDASPKSFVNTWEFYSKITSTASFALFVSSLDQIGFLEMSNLFSVAAQFDSFKEQRFSHTLKKFWEKRSNSISDLRLTIISSGRLLVDGAFAKASAMRPTFNNFSDTPRGVSKTNEWALESPCYDPESLVIPLSLSVVTGSTIRDANENVPEHLYLQFQLCYAQNGTSYIHVHTKIISTSNCPDCQVTESFDPKIEVAYLMKSTSYQILMDKFTSRQLERFRYQMDNIAVTKHNSREFLLLYYSLRRTPLLAIDNASPDERMLFLNQICHSSIEVCLRYALPTVLQFRDGKKLTRSLTHDLLSDPTATLLDGGYFICIRYAHRDMEDIGFVKELAKLIMADRFPEPLYIDTLVGGSQDRFFKSKLIPINSRSTKILGTQEVPFERFVALVEARSKGY